MKRWPHKIVLTLSLLALGASLWLWIESYWHARRMGWMRYRQDSDGVTVDVLQFKNRWGQAEICFERTSYPGGTLEQARQKQPYYSRDSGPFSVSFPADWTNQYWRCSDDDSFAARRGFYYVPDVPKRPRGSILPEEFSAVGFPNWLVVACASALQLIWLVRAIRGHSRSARGLCVGCGYDLRASVGRCPECGAGIREPTSLRARWPILVLPLLLFLFAILLVLLFPFAGPTSTDTSIAAHDLLGITVSGSGIEFGYLCRVDPDGFIRLPGHRGLRAGRLEPQQLARAVEQIYHEKSWIYNAKSSLTRVQTGAPPFVPGPFAVGDFAHIQIADLEGPGIYTRFIKRVGDDGTVELPYKVKVKVLEMFEPEMEEAIADAYRLERIIERAQVWVVRLSPEEAKALQD